MEIVYVLHEINLVHERLPDLNAHHSVVEKYDSIFVYAPPITSTNSEPAIERNGTPASAATAFASKVFPIPGGPRSKAPFGILAPKFYHIVINNRRSLQWTGCLPRISRVFSCIQRIPSLLVSLLSFRPRLWRKSSVCSLWYVDQPWWISLWSIRSNGQRARREWSSPYHHIHWIGNIHFYTRSQEREYQ